jgi:bifunctional N-acetylglucosamine-1-phosphate-uridyltransferase/glucosamine-1-phosphate-acetyltransferase GlmU-like protein
MPERGESDTGVFCLRSDTLRVLLKQARGDAARGKHTEEFNFLPIIPLAVAAGYSVLTPHVVHEEETIGINTPEDARRVEQFLRRMRA